MGTGAWFIMPVLALTTGWTLKAFAIAIVPMWIFFVVLMRYAIALKARQR